MCTTNDSPRGLCTGMRRKAGQKKKALMLGYSWVMMVKLISISFILQEACDLGWRMNSDLKVAKRRDFEKMYKRLMPVGSYSKLK